MLAKQVFGYFAFQVLFLPLTTAYVFQAGKVNISDTSQNNHGCRTVSFKTQFQGSGDVKVFATLSYGSEHVKIHDPASVWVKSVSTSGFDTCVREAGSGSGGASVINWLAFQGSHQGLDSGIVEFDEFTSRTQCKKISLSIQNKARPQVFVTVLHKHSDRPFDSMNIWLEDVKKDGFVVCLREFMSFDGIHSGLKVNWLAYDELPAFWNITERGKLHFSGLGAPKKENNYAFCQDYKFENPFYEPPSVLASARHDNDTSALWMKADGRFSNALNVWIEEITRLSFKLCIKDSQGISKSHDPVTVDYVVVGDIDPCTNVTCDYHAICKAFSAFDARCVCDDNCPSYEEPVCSSNSTTFKNKCFCLLDICKRKSNHTLYHPGSCTGFPVQTGRVSLVRRVKSAETACKVVKFPPFSFYPDKEVHVQITTNHWNISKKNFIHDATVSWVHTVNYENFEVCVTTAGRNDRSIQEFATVDWMAYQGAPDGGVAGKSRISQWWTGSQCEEVNFPQGKFATAPRILVTAQHISAAFKHDAASLWVENATSSSFYICLRELQNYDGLHEDIFVNWMVFETIHRPLFAESKQVNFPNNSPVSTNYNGAFCKDLQFARNYDKEPIIIIAASHNSEGRNLKPTHMSVTAWIEHIKTGEFRICLKELYANQHDPVNVTYAVLADVCKPGWSYFGGICYSTSQTCKNWTEAQNTCQSYSANLISVRNQEENVYIQHRMNGAKGWIGLNDRGTEGTFVWADNQTNNFTYWAKNQPNNFNNEDCVHTLGVGHSFMWNDVSCETCHNYTCSEDFDECVEDNNHCHQNAVCTNTLGSYGCRCSTGYTGDGLACTDIDECSSGHQCDSSATCYNTVGSYTCICNSGYTGDGRTCKDVDECSLKTHDCDSNAICNNTGGSFTCKCDGNALYYGDGKTCSHHRLDDSIVLANDASMISQLNSWLSPKLRSSNSYWKLCYRASVDGWRSRTFHNRCDSKGATVTIVKVRSYIFGGYNDNSWQGSSWSYQYSTNTFIYSLKNYYGYGYFKNDVSTYKYATYSGYSYGPTFGGGHDIYIADNARYNSYSYFNCHSYTSPYCDDSIWTGGRYFSPEEVEVYYEILV
ncbi:unnamed protein product [Porites evermanni]|uniref:Uncharacterized protein n=1 Tax=Porites evermanni TaxID=104178 RepID=A0ABN8QBQ4_9CNID|nr:unnamed protein product [Porites evermanni]